MYYIWELNAHMDPLFDEPVARSTTLANAKTSARIQATKGKHHRAVTKGRTGNPEVVRIYEKGTGRRIYPT